MGFKYCIFLHFCVLIKSSTSGIEEPNLVKNIPNSRATTEKPAGEVIRCQESNTSCNDGTCYRQIDLCDGWKDCSDGYDESPDVCDRSTDTIKFECLSGKFIDVSQVCDGNKDCKDGSDEDDVLCKENSNVTCAIPTSSSLRIQCEFKGTPIQCRDEVKAWTNVKIFCNLGYVPKNATLWTDTNKCHSSGKWIHPMPSCTFGCGTKMKDTYPWNIGVYQNTGTEFTMKCLGTLISPIHVLTDFKCIDIHHNNGFLGEEIKVGFHYLDYKSNGYKLIGVTDIKLIDDSGIERHYNDTQIPKNSVDRASQINMAVLQLSSHVDFSQYKPACFDLDRKLEMNLSSTGKIIGKLRVLPYIAEDYEVIYLQIMTSNNYKKFLEEKNFEAEPLTLNPDMICTFYECDSRCKKYENKYSKPYVTILPGTGLTVNINRKYFLYGIFIDSLKVQDKSGNNSYVYLFSDVRKLTPSHDNPGTSVNIAVNEIRSSDAHYLLKGNHNFDYFCKVPYTHGAIYTDEPCENKCSELLTHKEMEEYSVIFMYCKTNYTLKGFCNYKICEDGVWLPEDTTCVRLCEPLITAPTVKTNCSYEGKNISCTGKVKAETVASSTCETGGLSKDLAIYNNTCLHSGNWRDSPEVVEILCIDLCGILKTEKALIQDGEETNSTYHPWNAGVYYQYKAGSYANICGGTIISKHAVLTAAHCVHDRGGTRYDAKVLTVGLGKFYRKFNHDLDSGAQFRDVENVYVPNLYDGPPSRFVADLAILELKKAANLNELIVPACIDTSNKFAVKHNSIGTVVGWGLNGTEKTSKLSQKLMRADLPYLDRESCIEKSKEKYNTTLKITADKFCAVYFEEGKPIVRRGDSGSGITFKFEGRHYVYGLVSAQADNVTSMFTNVTYPDHLEFINIVLDKILENKKRINKNLQNPLDL